MKYGTFRGVFLNNFLTILGVIMYLRLSWVVGQVGLIGALSIIVMAKLITIATGLSISAIATNVKMGSGGAYYIINKSLGPEAGGSIGISLFISQSLSAALYIMGFAEVWIRIFPNHNYLYVVFSALTFIMAASYFSTNLALKIQVFIMGVIILSLVSFFASPFPFLKGSEIALREIPVDGYTFWAVFAIFFPAVTGIMSGVGMSGDLKDPKKSIPSGVMSSIFITMIIYFAMAVYFALLAPRDELLANTSLVIDVARFPTFVVAGIMGATLSSALGSILAAPRVLQAISQKEAVPFSRIFKKKSSTGEPKNALLLTGAIIACALALGRLNTIASVITMFFLITYGLINLIVFIQQSLKLVSFRPAFTIPRLVPLLGFFATTTVMFLIDPVFSAISIVLIAGLYVYLNRKDYDYIESDIRGGVFYAIAEWANSFLRKYPKNQASWRPEIFIALDDKVSINDTTVIKSFCGTVGSVYIYTFVGENGRCVSANEGGKALDVYKYLEEKDVRVYHGCITATMENNIKNVFEMFSSFTVSPNIIYLELSLKKKESLNKYQYLADVADKFDLGLLVYFRKTYSLIFEKGERRVVNLWLRDKSPNIHLSILMAIQIFNNTNCELNIVTVATNNAEKKNLAQFLNRLVDRARIPTQANLVILKGSFMDVLKNSQKADLNIIGLADKNLDIDNLDLLAGSLRSDCLFVKDSGSENAFL